MEFVIKSPVFYSSEDEDMFFDLIYSLSGYIDVRGVGTNLYITIAPGFTDKAQARIEAICERWGTEQA